MNSRQFAIIAGVTFFVGMVWLVASIIINTKASIEVSPELQVLLEPITPSFNTRVLDVIDKQTMDISDITVTTPTQPAPSAEPTPAPPTPLEITRTPDDIPTTETATESSDLNI